ncbi:MAG: S41 family peptidase [Muribaculaceae bacterium]|nr:S41 family peptidase [Muribaculaceae bacterium]
MKKVNKIALWLPLIVAVSVAGGIWIGSKVLGDSAYSGKATRKLDEIFRLIEQSYVDNVNIDSITELTIPKFLERLDPHTVYIPAAELADVNSELEGSFSGVGVSFSIMNDTVTIVEIVSGGPAEKVGMLAGDRIITVNDSVIAGNGVTNRQVFGLLRGQKDTQVKLGIKRKSSADLLDFTVIRGDIPVTSIDSDYMLNDSVGYVKINKFGRTTYDEFINALALLQTEGAKSFVIDLRGNGGGFMEMAVLMANEFLSAGQPIVFTRGRGGNIEQAHFSDGHGSFKDAPIVVLLDEFSASASEILAGAIQDNDRGLIIGRRSFGKGLVQNQIELPDSSAVRLTVQRYYTPAGRCIQKVYTPGNPEAYTDELLNRFNNGEAFDADKISFDETLKYTTTTGRTVYGGGGIMPDIFVPSDTSSYTNYYIQVANAGLLQKFAFNYADVNRTKLEDCITAQEVMDNLPSDDALLQSFVSYAARNGVPARWYYINISRPLIVNQLKALIARDVLGTSAYYEIVNGMDVTVKEALKAIEAGKAAFPIE